MCIVDGGVEGFYKGKMVELIVVLMKMGDGNGLIMIEDFV